jgi:hypothetical protein
MRKVLLGCFAALVLASSCGNDKTHDNQPVKNTSGAFVARFPQLPLPRRITDTLLEKALPDSAWLKPALYTTVIPDSIFVSLFGKKAKPKLCPLSRATNKEGITYLLLKAVAGDKKAGYVICVDASGKFLAALPLVSTDADAATADYGELDNAYTLTVMRQRKDAGGTTLYKKEYYMYSNGGFTLVSRETNDVDAALENVYNPIDTFPAKNKYSGDYVKSKTNLISIRDGKDARTFAFFVHFDRGEEDCSGELSGTATWASADSAIFRQDGDPCQLAFLFRGNEVRLREVQGCGNYRGVKCFFEGSYPRKKTTAPAKNKEAAAPAKK